MIEVFFNELRDWKPEQARELRSPLIKVSLIVPTKAGVDQIIPNLTCLIDTGSDYCPLDTGFAETNNLPTLGKVTSFGMGASISVDTYKCTVIFDDTARLAVGFGGYPFRMEKNDFDLSLGMQALQHFDFVLKAAEQKATLQFRG